VSSSVGTTAKASSAAQPSTPVHSGFQRSQSSIPSTSLDSSGFVIDKARTSGEGYRDGVGAAAQHRDREEESAPAAPKWNVCPAGCGCRCRGVAGSRARELHEDGAGMSSVVRVP
jgi:hypothetical protein